MPNHASQTPYHHGDLRRQLLESAERRLRDQGAGALSLRELAREIGVSHAAPRRHFADRQSLLDALSVDGYLRLGAALRRALAGRGPFPDRTHSAAAAYARFATENAALHELMISGKHRPGATSVADAADVAFRPMIDLIEDGQSTGQLAPVDPARLGLILFATMQGITMMVNGGMIAADLLDQLVSDAVDQFLRGVRPLA